MLDFLHSSRRVSTDRLLAVGGSLAIHGIAVAAVMATLAGGAVEDSPSPPMLTLAFEWVAAPNAETGQLPAAADGSSRSTVNTVDTASSISEPVIDDAAPQVETAAAAEAAMADIAAIGLTEPTRRSLPPPRKPKIAATAKTHPAAARDDDEIAEAEHRQATTIAADTGAQLGDEATNVATIGAASAAAPARNAGARPSWSVTSRTPPSYPMSARRRGIEGEVELRVDVDSDGKPKLVTIARSSGDRQLDGAAARAVEQWRFAVAAPMAIEIPIQFRLNVGDTAAMQP